MARRLDLLSLVVGKGIGLVKQQYSLLLRVLIREQSPVA